MAKKMSPKKIRERRNQKQIKKARRQKIANRGKKKVKEPEMTLEEAYRAFPILAVQDEAWEYLEEY